MPSTSPEIREEALLVVLDEEQFDHYAVEHERALVARSLGRDLLERKGVKQTLEAGEVLSRVQQIEILLGTSGSTPRSCSAKIEQGARPVSSKRSVRRTKSKSWLTPASVPARSDASRSSRASQQPTALVQCSVRDSTMTSSTR